jgi:two-component system NarL family sensor kinase
LGDNQKGVILFANMNQEEIFLSIISTTLIILLLLAGILITFFISGRQRARQEMKLAQAKLDFEKELRQVENEVSEHILSQFAQELHDNIGQLLTAMHIQLENQKLDHPQLADGLKPIDIYLDEVTQQLRLLSRTLNNDYLGHIGLLSAIQLEVDRLKTLRRFDVSWEPVTGPSNLGKNQELMTFRILQEIIQNALRHSAAKHLAIKVSNKHNHFELQVKDDGKGFSLEETLQSQKASGIRNIMKRARLAGLECQIETSPGKGCLYILKKMATLD